MPVEDLTAFTHNALLEVRKKLLDLSKRNRLLNFKETARSIQINNESPNEVFEMLVHNKKSIPIIPLAEEVKNNENTTKNNKDSSGQNLFSREKTDDSTTTTKQHHVLSARHKEFCLQTPYTAVLLEKRCNRLHQDARIAIEETGCNFLYLAIGFLEWYEDDESSIAYHAPLILVPIHLERFKIDPKTNCFKYRLGFTEEDIETNLSLAEMISLVFDLKLPELNEDTDPEQYFKQVSDLIEIKPKWQVLNKMFIGTFSFSKILMYKDLASDNWPNGHKITDHEKIREILRTKESSKNSSSTTFEEEYDIDKDPKAAKVPLILDADSSQISAIVDILNGNDLVIEGPPGTGKSQTITNLIASALYDDKSVLFVAEKKAALDIVRRRLDQTGLGDFCLELHSTKKQKGKLHGDIKKRIDRKFKEPSELKNILNDLIKERDTLSSYINLMNKKAGPSEETIYGILWKANRWRSELPEHVVFFTTSINLTRDDIQERENTLKEIIQLYKEIPPSSMKAWYDYKPINILPGDEQQFKLSLTTLMETTEALVNYLMNLINTHGFPLPSKPTLDEVVELSQIINTEINILPDFFDQNIVAKLINPMAIEAINQLKDFITEYKSLIKTATDILQNQQNLSFETASKIKTSIEVIGDSGYGNLSIQELKDIFNEADKVAIALNNLKALGESTKGVLTENLDNIKDFENLLSVMDLIKEAPADIDVYAHVDHLTPFGIQLFYIAKSESIDIQLKIDKYSSFFNISQLPHFKELKNLSSELRIRSGKTFSFLSPTLRKLKRRIKEFLVNPKLIKHPEVSTKLNEIASLLERRENIRNNDDYTKVLGSLFKGIETDWNRLEKHVFWSQELYKKTGSQAFSEKIMKNIRHCRDFLGNLSQKIRPVLAQTTDGIKKIFTNFQTDTSLSTIVQQINDALTKLQPEARFISSCIQNDKLNLSLIKNAADAVIKASNLSTLVDNNSFFVELLGSDFNGVNTEIERFCFLAGWALSLHKKVTMAPIVKWVLNQDTPNRLEILKNCAEKTADYLSIYQSTAQVFKDNGEFDEKTFFGQFPSHCKLSTILEKSNDCMKHIVYLFLWSDYCQVRDKAIRLGLDKIIEAIEEKSMEPNNAIPTYFFNLYNDMARKIIKQYPELTSFTRASYENKRKRFVELDKQVMKLFRQDIAAKIARRPIPNGINTGPVGQFTDWSLIEHEINKRKRHIPIRKLVRRAGAALKALKPCFMMSPLSVAQYLAPGEINFDLVVMDEASQIKPEDALGAIARSNKVVIVGDSNQLPPTTFFERINESPEAEEESSAIEDTESILDICRITYKSRRLRWHYRSEHESLIAFSNSHFYDNDLIVFPSPFRTDVKLGITSYYVKNATYSKGKNLKEAQEIVNEIAQHFINNPDLSLGVATFNKEQRDLIEDLLDKNRKMNPWLDKIIKETEDKEEPFFIKNLENVQGDERDVIFISFTYGPDVETRKVYQRFGPIGGEAGWRRLNVLFTRAKKHILVFTSMLSTDLVPNETTSRGVIVMRDYLDYAVKGYLRDPGQISKKEPQSDFEISVAKVLKNSGYKAVFQVGVAGFFIDIGVLHMEREGDFIMGIECDGATYHTGKSVRDRDRLRQEILERKGWYIHRIWSTDWFKNRESETERLLKILKHITSKDMRDTRGAVAEPIKPYMQHKKYSIPASLIDKKLNETKEDLKQKLLLFRKDNIEPRFPDQTKGILRDELIEYFAIHMPTTREEFRAKIPLRFRENIDRNQVQFLDDIFLIIEEYS